VVALCKTWIEIVLEVSPEIINSPDIKYSAPGIQHRQVQNYKLKRMLISIIITNVYKKYSLQTRARPNIGIGHI